MKSPAPREWRLVTRIDCHLCEEMAAVLESDLGRRGEAWSEIDVDQDPDLSRRFGDVVPVLLRDGQPVAKVRLDGTTLRRIITSRR